MMRTAVIGIGLLVLGAVGCSSEDDSGPELLDGFAPSAPGAGEIQVVGPITTGIESGQDITFCSYLDFEFDETFDVTSFVGFQSHIGAHHIALFQVPGRGPVETHECDENDMLNARYIAGGGSADTGLTLPEGVVRRVDAGNQLMVQHHWVNTTEAAISGQAVVNLTVQAPSDDVDLAGLFLIGDTQFSVEAGGTGSAHSECTIQRELNGFMITGHAHEWGTRVRLTHTPVNGEPVQVYDSVGWNETFVLDPPRLGFTRAEPFVLAVGDKLAVDCTFSNPTQEPLSFPHEMCFGVIEYFPATMNLDCTDGIWTE